MMDYRHIERFNRIAVERELSAGAILLWQQLYCMMQRKNNFSDVKICTAVLLGFLDLTRNGFQKARKALVEAGVLGIRYEGEDIYYTLELVNFPSDYVASKSPCLRTITPDQKNVGCAHAGADFESCLALNKISGARDEKAAVDIAVNSANTVGRHDHMPPLAQRANMESPDGDAFSVLQSGTTSSVCASSLARFSAFSADEKAAVDIAVNSANTVGRHDHMPPLAQSANSTNPVGEPIRLPQIYAEQTINRKLAVPDQKFVGHIRPYSETTPHYPSGDIISNNGYEETMKEFTAVHRDGELYGVLRQWAEMRRENGWTLSLWGLQELLRKLAALAAGDIKTMIATVRQSLARRWKGFHPLRKECKPSGEKLRQEERQREWLEAQQKRNGRTTQKFRKEERDLSFLEI